MSDLKPSVSLIVAQAENRVIGCQNQLPWHLPEDLKYFRRVTMGKPVIMGRKTFESIGRLLPGRLNVVVTRQPDWSFPGAQVASDLQRAVELASQQGAEEVMIIGGSQIYEQAIPIADRIYLTQVHRSYEGDAWFPKLIEADWQEVSCEDGIDPDSGIKFSFVTLQRQFA